LGTPARKLDSSDRRRDRRPRNTAREVSGGWEVLGEAIQTVIRAEVSPVTDYCGQYAMLQRNHAQPACVLRPPMFFVHSGRICRARELISWTTRRDNQVQGYRLLS
jgi:hypothetical protein